MTFRKVHIGEATWEYFVGKKFLNIYSPEGKKHLIEIDKFLGMSWSEIWESRYEYQSVATAITPSKIKTYIEANLIGK